jgi:hypothetical protein
LSQSQLLKNLNQAEIKNTLHHTTSTKEETKTTQAMMAVTMTTKAFEEDVLES